jgi:hypothetical protein
MVATEAQGLVVPMAHGAALRGSLAAFALGSCGGAEGSDRTGAPSRPGLRCLPGRPRYRDGDAGGDRGGTRPGVTRRRRKDTANATARSVTVVAERETGTETETEWDGHRDRAGAATVLPTETVTRR